MNDILAALPKPSTKRVALRISPSAERTLRQGHPWLFDRAIQHQSHEGTPGDLTVVFDRKRRFLAIGLYDPTSPIRVRLLQHNEPVTIDMAWFQKHLNQSIAIRTPLHQSNTDGYRLVHGENDRLPGVVIDRYADTLVVKLDTIAWVPHLHDVLTALDAALSTVIAPKRIVLRLSRSVQRQSQYLHGLYDGMLLVGPPVEAPLLFCENGLRFEVDPIHGQKTGFFLDQRDNRATVETLAKGKTVLNVFAYTGGFSLYAARGGARSVTSLDISQPALDAAARNFALNQDHAAIATVHHQLLAGDAFRELEKLYQQRRRFDLIVIDPPAFAKKQSEVPSALAAYAQLTRLGLQLLSSSGTIVLASCSSRVDTETFFANIHRTARQMGYTLHEFKRTQHALDHPIGFAQGAYLKCLFSTASRASHSQRSTTPIKSR